MNNYEPVQKALTGGADPAMLCATCPWDRFCITPPAMTSGEVEARIKEASAEDERSLTQARTLGKDPGMPVQTLMAAMVYAGKDTSASVCPVFALRLRSSGGQRIAATVKTAMQGWDDQQ